ncbi:dipeptide/oligopeptide/nickel ABC transporter permease/ATP-binding protein [Kribbella capetownensis]|uniref:Dipeptide/oligopeptide/nickel ABC transporter permease/ATP-binding protein n=1 Tax=Kribbella capetownensis TaxID=1572659 RepID=A0A4R0JI42_9ACTN|nr:dipeptide/oligopeptide/nickel ABC transporter permease/ATP-binding protein [Kribbella capetownensis]TCC44308.1 dipeptide/oligopeptide/nickel ABC transporter permease/ATP-binding protein [Kribbella capetownensis]
MTQPVTQPVGVENLPVRRGLLRPVLRNPLAIGALAVLSVIVLASLLAPLIAPHSPTSLRLDQINAGPGDGYLLGGDGAGRDIFSRLLYAGRNTLLGAAIALSVALALGVLSGLLSGYYGGFLDGIFGWGANLLMALPTMIVLLALFQALGSSIYLSMVAFGVMLSPGFYRLVRGQVMAVKHELYVDAARVSGLSDPRIIGRHILLVVRAPVVIQASVVAGIAIVVQSGLEFLGLGDPATPTWGGMLQDAFTNIYTSPIAIWWPGMTIALTVASLVLLGNAIRDVIQRTTSSSTRLPKPQPVVALPPVLDDRESALLRIRNLSVGYPSGAEVVHGVDLDVRRGEVLGLVGESGSGKTQTAFSVLGLLPPGGTLLGSSSIQFDGAELARLPENERRVLRGRRIGYIPQEPMSNLDPCFRVGQQLVEPLRAVAGLSKRAAIAEALSLLERVGIPEPRRTFAAYPHEISGGMAQRVLIAGAVSGKPDLLIADEPTTALDVTVQADVLELLRDLQTEFGMAMLLVTHNFGVVADICDRVAVMQDGRIVETGDVRPLFADPRHPYTKSLLESTLEDSTPRTRLEVNHA